MATDPPETGGNGSEKQRRRDWKSNCLLIAASVFVALVAVEIILRVTGFSSPSFYEPDPICGYRLRPGVEGRWQKEGNAYVKINRAGFRDDEFTLTESPSTYRIAVLGDSFAEALQVDLEEAFHSVMERELEASPVLTGKNVEVFNFGVSGFGTAQEFILLQETVSQYSPDLVLLALVTENDIRNNSKSLNQDEMIPYFVYRDGELVLDNSFLSSKRYRSRRSLPARIAYSAINYSRLLQLLYHVKSTISLYQWNQQVHEEAAEAGFEAGLDEVVYLEPVDVEWEEAWRITEALIAKMDDEVSAMGAEFLIVTLSAGIQVHPDPAIRDSFMENLGVSDLYYPDHRIEDFCNKNSIPALNLAPLLHEYAQENGVYLHGFGDGVGDGHWNESGHEQAGKLISRAIEAGFFGD